MIFDFDQQKVYTKSIEVDDIGNCALRCTNDCYEEFYVIVQTSMGKSYITKFGPLIPDLETVSPGFVLTHELTDFKEKVIIKAIDTLINDARKKIINVENITAEEALVLIPTADKFIPA